MNRVRLMLLLAACGLVLSGTLSACVAPTRSSSPTPAAASAAPSAHPEDREPGRPGTDDFEVRATAVPDRISGYTNPVSTRSGGKVGLFVSTGAPRVAVRAYRIGGYVGGRGRLVWSGTVPGSRQPRPALVRSTRTVVARWLPTAVLDTRGWPPGFYVIKLTASTGAEYGVPFVVRSASTRGRVALVLPTHTWQAYNAWGGYSLYGKGPQRYFPARSRAVSYDRPYQWPGTGEFAYAAQGFVTTAETAHVKLAYLTDVDLETHPGLLRGARGVVSIGHDEYWSLARRKVWDAARDAGTNVLITGANTMYWRVRTAEGLGGSGPDRLLIGYKSARLDPEAASDPAQATTLWIDHPDPQPQDTSTGMLYECFPVHASWTVADPQWWGFAGTGVSRGERFRGLLGVEADRVYPLPSRPRPMHVLADQAYPCDGRPTSAQAIEYAAPSGAVVIDLNSLRWTCALDPDCPDGRLSPTTRRFARRVTVNIVREFALGPAAARHPVRDDVGRYSLPSYRTVYPNPD